MTDYILLERGLADWLLTICHRWSVSVAVSVTLDILLKSSYTLVETVSPV